MTEKRYFWLKMPKDFFESEEVKFLEEQENGYCYSNIYLKMLLKSIDGDGVLIRHVGKQLIPYDAAAIARLTGQNIDTVKVAVDLFIKLGLMEMTETGEIFMTELQKMIGSESGSANRVRAYRERHKALHCNEDVTEKPLLNVSDSLQSRYRDGQNVTLENKRIRDLENKSIKENNMSGKPDHASGSSQSTKRKKTTEQYKEPVNQIVNYLNEKTGKHFRPETKETQRLIIARLREGRSINDFYKVIDIKVKHWAKNPDMQQYLQPSTLFGSKFEGYLNSVPDKTSEEKELDDIFGRYEL